MNFQKKTSQLPNDTTLARSIPGRCLRQYRIFAGIALYMAAVLPQPCAAIDRIEMAGNILQYVLPAAAGCATIINRDFKGAVQFAEAVAVNEAVTFSLKYTVHEQRPNGADFHSFPSGHTSISFTSAEFMRKRYGWWYGGPAYALAAFTGYSRVESRWHYFHDVAAGAAIGFLSSYVFTKPFKGIRAEADAAGGNVSFRIQSEF